MSCGAQVFEIPGISLKWSLGRESSLTFGNAIYRMQICQCFEIKSNGISVSQHAAFYV